MMFCPKCKSILMPRMMGGKRVMGCSCGYKAEGNVTITEEVRNTAKAVEVVDKEKSDDALPLTDNTCKKCGNKKAYFWELQTRSADEPATRFYKCQKCKHVWREYK
ncbi:transcription factor S [Candidatus Woesearchaeota archaeon]|nr:transcription factor S [Candidatus Woesearchaeota archaeon]